MSYLYEEVVQLITVFLKDSQLLTHPPNTFQVVEKCIELISDLFCDLINLFLAIFPYPITYFNNLISLYIIEFIIL